ncbi:MAG: hypothetical protein KAI81_09560, partial [Candidatus Marinimicrobia bacterium]|nr:hypothetical protein [Candidatus Neomarinimicrobiota bacterium]
MIRYLTIILFFTFLILSFPSCSDYETKNIDINPADVDNKAIEILLAVDINDYTISADSTQIINGTDTSWVRDTTFALLRKTISSVKNDSNLLILENKIITVLDTAYSLIIGADTSYLNYYNSSNADIIIYGTDYIDFKLYNIDISTPWDISTIDAEELINDNISYQLIADYREGLTSIIKVRNNFTVDA